jgi:hypothetical protein
MSDTMQGQRVEWPDGLLKPAEYAKGPDGTWYATTPNDHLANLCAHAVTEHDDGTITVSPSILVSTPRAGDGPDGMRSPVLVELWHGFLERGVWRSV